MYEELVKRLRERAAWINFPHHGEEYPTEDAKLMMDAADAIEELSKSRWIPVAERLPENNTRILIVTKSRNGRYWIDTCRFTNNLHEFDEYDFPNETRPGFFRYDNEYGWTEITDVTHWMPLPTPPKEET